MPKETTDVKQPQDYVEQLASYASTVRVTVQGKCFELHRAASLEELWDSMTATPQQAEAIDDERLPYWTELWPSSVALAQWLVEQKNTIEGRTCLDLGCGLGLTALVGQWLGARVIGMDYEEAALGFARKNAVNNHIAQPLWTVMDWRKPAVQRGSIDVLWGGDIMYERRFVTPVLDFLEYVLKKNGRAWIAEPCRNVYQSFRSELFKRNWTGRRVFETQVDPIYAQPSRVTVHVWELSR